MGGDDSQKLLPWRGIHSSPGRKPPAQLRINNVTETAGWNLARGTPSFCRSGRGLTYRPHGSLLEGRGGSVLARAEGLSLCFQIVTDSYCSDCNQAAGSALEQTPSVSKACTERFKESGPVT